LQSGLPWPRAYMKLLPSVQQELGSEGTICLSRELRGGKSGAQVYVADVHSPNYTGQVILKFDECNHPNQVDESEAFLLTKAISDAPDFAKKHLPKLLLTAQLENQSAILSTIAGRGLEYADPWPEVDFDKQLFVTKQFSRELLTEWNKDYKLGNGMHMPQELLASWLGHRLHPSEGGRIHDFLMRKCGLDPSAPSIAFEGQWYPNPLAFAEGIISIPNRLQIRTVTGRCHGDLHGMNLLVGHVNPEATEYFLIDLADYQDSQFLFFDHAYFELAYLLTARDNTSAGYWETVFETLSRRHSKETSRSLRADDLGLMQIIDALRRETNDWIEQQEHDRLSYMESQYLLARTAAGLNYAHKNIDCRMRSIAFVYAASNLKDYLELNRLDWPKHGPSFSIVQNGGNSDAGHLTKTTSQPQDQGIAVSGSSATQTEPTRRQVSHHPKSEPSKGSIFAELRRRQVFKAAAGYIVVAWVCLQVAAVMQSSLKLPEWTDSLVATLLTLGFPIACILAWAYEMSPTGIQRKTPASSREHKPSRAGVAADYFLGIGVLLILLISVANPIYGRFVPSKLNGAGAVGQKSIAVLPFRNLSDTDEKDHFSDGLTIEIINTLARTGKFRIPGQHSLFSFKDKNEDLRTIGNTLGVEYILEGSVRRNGDDFRIEAQLVQADDGFLIWSNIFEESLQDLSKLQQKLAFDIGTALETPLQAKAERADYQMVPNAQAYELYLQALGHYAQRGEHVEKAAQKLEESVRLDPNFAAAWAALSLVYDVLPAFVDSEGEDVASLSETYRKADEFAAKAYELDPELPIVQHAMGNRYRRSGQWSQAEDLYRKALDSRINAHQIMEDYGELLSTVGRHQQAIAMTENAVEADPLNSLYEYMLLEAKWNANPGKESAESFISFFKRETPFQTEAARVVIGYLTSVGRSEELIELINNCTSCDASWRNNVLTMLDDVKELPAENVYEIYGDAEYVGYLFLKAIGGTDLVLGAFQSVVDPASPPIVNRSVPWAVIADVGSTNKFKQLAEQWKLPAYWRERGWPDNCQPLENNDFECN